jgi:hypothetical protein
VFERLEKFVAFAELASKKVDREKQDQFSSATVLSKKLEVVKKKVEGFDDNLERDFSPMMQELNLLFRDLLQHNTISRLPIISTLTLN